MSPSPTWPRDSGSSRRRPVSPPKPPPPPTPRQPPMFDSKINAAAVAAFRASGSGFSAYTDHAAAQFNSYRAELSKAVRDGELTPKAARRKAAAKVDEIREDLAAKAAG